MGVFVTTESKNQNNSISLGGSLPSHGEKQTEWDEPYWEEDSETSSNFLPCSNSMRDSTEIKSCGSEQSSIYETPTASSWKCSDGQPVQKEHDVSLHQSSFFSVTDSDMEKHERGYSYPTSPVTLDSSEVTILFTPSQMEKEAVQPDKANARGEERLDTNTLSSLSTTEYPFIEHRTGSVEASSAPFYQDPKATNNIHGCLFLKRDVMRDTSEIYNDAYFPQVTNEGVTNIKMMENGSSVETPKHEMSSSSSTETKHSSTDGVPKSPFIYSTGEILTADSINGRTAARQKVTTCCCSIS